MRMIFKILTIPIILGLAGIAYATRVETEVVEFQAGISVASGLNMSGAAITNVLAGTAPLDAVNLTQLQAATATPFPIAYASTVTISRANGWVQSYVPSAATTILIATGATGGVDQVNLSLWAGTNSITFGTGNVTFATAITPATNATTTILYYSPWLSTNWSASEL